MGVVVDTNIWSRWLRSRTTGSDDRVLLALRELIATGDAWIIGAIRQEVLSGIADAERFRAVRDQLRMIADTPVITSDYERAATFSNLCRAAGVSSTGPDMLTCAVAERLGAPIYTLDGDFERYREVLGVDLYL